MSRHRRTERPRILVLEGLSGSTAAVRRAGGEAITVPPLDTDAVLDALDQGFVDGLLLTGGGDVDPRHYGQRARREVYGVSEKRDLTEMLALDAAREDGLPVLGICRGAQVMNVQAGGTLHQHLPDMLKHRRHGSGEHLVRAEAGSELRRAFRAERAAVVSLHHQAVDVIAPGFHASGWALDGTVEAIESDDGRCIGVQFHPEMWTEKPCMQRLFDSLVAKSAERAGIEYIPRAWQAPKPARQPVTPRPRRKSKKVTTERANVTTTWRCFRCDIDFDKRRDHLDHMAELHGIDFDLRVVR